MFTTLLSRPRTQTVYRGGSAADPPGWLSGMFGPRTTSGEVVTSETALTISTYFACLRNLSEDVGKLPCKLFEDLEPRGKRQLKGDPLYGILHDQVNPTLSAQVCWELITQWTAGWGNGYAEIERSRRGDPIGLWPIHPSRVKPRKRAEDPYVVVGDNGRENAIPRESMFHVRGMGDELRGYSVCELAAESLGLSLAAQTFGAAYFGNDAALGIVIKVPSDTALTEEQIRDLRGSWIKPHVGANNAYKPKVLSDGITAERISIPPKDSQFLETRTFQVVDVCRWFRMPPHKVQHLDKATFSNIEQQSIEYVSDTLTPWLTRIETECRLKLISADQRPRRYVRFIVLGLLRGDSAARATFHKEMFFVGAASPNDIRELEDLNPRDGGDEYYIPANMIAGSAGSAEGQVNPADQAVNAAAEAAAADLQFKRDVVRAFLADGTTNDVIYNRTAVSRLLEQVNIPLDDKYTEPWLPVVAASGPLVSGEVIEDSEGDVVGGDVLKGAAPQVEPQGDDPETDPDGGDDDKDDDAAEDDVAEDSAPNAVATALMPVAVEAIGRLIRREQNAVGRARAKYGSDSVAYQAWAAGFFDEHAGIAVEALCPIGAAMAKLLGKDANTVDELIRSRAIAWMAERRSAGDDYPDGWAAAAAVELTQMAFGC